MTELAQITQAIKVFILNNFTFRALINEGTKFAINISDAFKMVEAQCVIRLSCQFIPVIPLNNNNNVYVTDTGSFTDYFLSAFLFPIIVMFGFIIIFKAHAHIEENMVFPIALFVILMVAWGGAGSIFPIWTSLLVILITAGGMAYSIGNYFLGNKSSGE